MKKREKKLSLHRETVLRLDAQDLDHVKGAGPHTSETVPCCGETITVDTFGNQRVER
jgi:hypothetical protein